MMDTIVRTRVTWARWDVKRMKNVISHPVVWIWTDTEGTERVYSTRAEAVAAFTKAKEAET